MNKFSHDITAPTKPDNNTHRSVVVTLDWAALVRRSLHLDSF